MTLTRTLALALALVGHVALARAQDVLDDSAAAALLAGVAPAHPRLLLTAALLDTLRARVARPATAEATYYARLCAYADTLLAEPPLVRRLAGRRLLAVSRDAVRRIGALALVWRLSGGEAYAKRLDAEVAAVAGFRDWNPAHFLDVAEAAYAVAIGLDWGEGALAPATAALARRALVDKALVPGRDSAAAGVWWATTHNNWAQVCHGALAVAALAVVEDAPALAAGTLARATAALPRGLAAYAPDGAYPEGASYWRYATTYTALMASALASAVGDDLGLLEAPGFVASAGYSVALAGPTGAYFDYFDASATGAHSAAHESLLAFFAARAPGRTPPPDRRRLREALLREWADGEPVDRFAHAGLVWLAGLPPDTPAVARVTAPPPIPSLQVFGGPNPVAVLRYPAPPGAPPRHALYLAAKGGRAGLNHGNMDAGSFVFELDGVRWGVDPGNQDYRTLEDTLGRDALWDRSQASPRWRLLTKGVRGHSTLVVDGADHRVDAPADLTAVAGDSAFAVDLAGALDARAAQRTFTVDGARTLRIADSLALGPEAGTVTWQLITRADVSVQPFGALLTQDGRRLAVSLSSPVDFDVAVVPLDPPPLAYDKRIPNLSRLEFRIPADQLRGLPLEVVLSGG